MRAALVGLVVRLWGAVPASVVANAAAQVDADPTGITVVSFAPVAPMLLSRYSDAIAALAPLAYDARALVFVDGPRHAMQSIRVIFQGMIPMAVSQDLPVCSVPADTIRDAAHMGSLSALSHAGMWDGAANALNLEIACSAEGLAVAATCGIAATYAATCSKTTLARVTETTAREVMRRNVCRWIKKVNPDGSARIPSWISVLWHNGRLDGPIGTCGYPIARAQNLNRPA